MNRLFFIIFFNLIGFWGYAQKIKYTKSFLQKVEKTGIDIFTPVEGKYKSKRPTKNDYLSIDHIIYSKKENLEIRYAIFPFEEKNLITQIPHIDFMRVLTTTATNETDNATATISVHSMEEEDLKEKFHADWGSIAYFQPKTKFAGYKHCRLLGLYQEGKGMIYVFFLFDEPSRFLDNRLHSLSFKSES